MGGHFVLCPGLDIIHLRMMPNLIQITAHEERFRTPIHELLMTNRLGMNGHVMITFTNQMCNS